jgi:hypothetical protein
LRVSRPLLSLCRVQSLTSIRGHPLRNPTRVGPPRGCHPSRVSFPSTFDTVDSDLRRVCLTRLRCVFRFSQPLDALFRPQPSSLLSCRSRPWDSSSEKAKLLFRLTCLAALSPLRVSDSRLDRFRLSSPIVRLSCARMRSASDVLGCYPITADRPFHDVSPSRFSPRWPRPFVVRRCVAAPTRVSWPPLVGFSVPLDDRSSIDTHALQSFKEPPSWAPSFEVAFPP